MSMGVSWAAAMAATARIARVSLGLIRINSPQIMFEHGRREEAGYHAAAGDNRAILPLPDVSHQKRSVLDVAGTTPAQQLVSLESGLNGRLAGQTLRKDHRVFDRHAAALPQIRRARMGGGAEQRHAS